MPFTEMVTFSDGVDTGTFVLSVSGELHELYKLYKSRESPDPLEPTGNCGVSDNELLPAAGNAVALSIAMGTI